MAIFYTKCVFFRRAVKEILDEQAMPINESIVIMDSRCFSGLGHMLYVCRFLQKLNPSLKVIIMLDEYFSPREVGSFIFFAHLQDSLSRWTSVIKSLMHCESSLDKTVLILEELAKLKSLSFKHLITIDCIRRNMSVMTISLQLDVSSKTVYGYMSDLKNYFNQPTLSHLYYFIAKTKFSFVCGPC